MQRHRSRALISALLISFSTLAADNGLVQNSRGPAVDHDRIETHASPSQSDPLAVFNRAMFTVNDRLYFWVLKPVGGTWGKVVPSSARTGIGNFFANLRAPGRVVNALLQKKVGKAGTEIRRFAVNSSVGVLGFRDAAARSGIAPPSPEDFGQTLAVWNVNAGCYVVWPLLGPSTLRGTVGRFADRALDPVSYVEDARWPIAVGELTNRTSFEIGRYEKFKASTVDPYQDFREVYLRARNKRIAE